MCLVHIFFVWAAIYVCWALRGGSLVRWLARLVRDEGLLIGLEAFLVLLVSELGLVESVLEAGGVSR